MSSEARSIAAVQTPATQRSLISDLVSLGLRSGDVVLVHSSMSALGWTVGGPHAVVEALRQAVGTNGTIVMPTQSAQLSDPADWQNPPVPEHWVPIIRSEMPPYDPYATPTREMGQIVECFRQYRDTIRSNHPLYSFAANGALAATIVADHGLEDGFGDGSPLAKMYDADAKVLFLGTGHANNTSLHLAETRAQWSTKASSRQSAMINVEGEPTLASWVSVETDESDFGLIGDAFDQAGNQTTGPVGAGTGIVMSQRTLVDFGVAWIESNRPNA